MIATSILKNYLLNMNWILLKYFDRYGLFRYCLMGIYYMSIPFILYINKYYHFPFSKEV